MIPANLSTDLRSPTKLAGDQYRAVLVEPAIVQVLDQRADALIEDREVLALAIENRVVRTAVPVPLAVVQRHDSGTCFDQSPRHQQTLRHARRAIAVDRDFRIASAVTSNNARVFLRQIKCLGQPRRRQEPHCLIGEGIHALHHPRRIGIAAEAVNAPHQRAPVGQSL